MFIYIHVRLYIIHSFVCTHPRNICISYWCCENHIKPQICGIFATVFIHTRPILLRVWYTQRRSVPLIAHSFLWSVKILRPKQNGRHFADGVLKCIFINEDIQILFRFHWGLFRMFVLFHVMAWCRNNIGRGQWRLMVSHGNDELSHWGRSSKRHFGCSFLKTIFVLCYTFTGLTQAKLMSIWDVFCFYVYM